MDSESKIWPDVMVDIETTGTAPNRSNIIQIAAVKFNYDTGEVCHEFFDRCLHLVPWRSWDEGARIWWNQQKRSILEGITARSENPVGVMNLFIDWVGFNGARLWAKPSHFEYPFIESYCTDFNLPNPFDYRSAIDMRSFIRGGLGSFEISSEIENIPFQGDAHNALHDTLHQLRVLFAARERINASRHHQG